METPKEPAELSEGEHDLLSENVKSRKHGNGDFERTLRFTGAPSDEQLRQLQSRLTASSDKLEKKGKGFKQAIAIATTASWLMRVRHYVAGKYWRCLQYQGFCPFCLSEKLDKKARLPSDAYIGNIIWFETDIDGVPVYEGGKLVWHSAFTIMGGKKVERVKDQLKLYEGNPAGVVLQTTLTNPDFSDWECSPYPDRSKFVKDVVLEMVDKDGDGVYSWKKEVLERVAADGLPSNVREIFLCKEISAAEAIKTFGLDDVKEQFESLVKQDKKAIDSAPKSGKSETKPTSKPQPKPAAKEAAPPQEEDIGEEPAGESLGVESLPDEPEEVSTLGNVMDEL